MGDQENKKPLLIRAIEWLSEVSGYIGGLAILVSTIIIVHQVLVRYFWGIPAIWQIETSVYLLLITSFVGAAYGLKHDAHVGIDLIVMKLAPRFQRMLRIFTSILCMGLTVIVAWKAWLLWWEATTNGWKSESLLSAPLTIPYFILPLGMVLITLQFIVLIYNDWVWLKTNSEGKTPSSKEIKTDTIKT